MLLPIPFVLLPAVALAAVTTQDPSDIIDLQQWASDNDLVADCDVPFPSNGQPKDCEYPKIARDINVRAKLIESLAV